mmetsp:Transcript_19881/g.50565  ORF Transcript_19881/g.50565 Transcript_19881/m.50565 type:complete len:309 (+) Transcript_19881:49-975(+)
MRALDVKQLAAWLVHRQRQQQQRREAAAAAITRSKRMWLRRQALVSLISGWAADGGGHGRRIVERAEGGWSCSTLAGYLGGDDVTYTLNFRMTRQNVEFIAGKLSAAGYLCDNKCRNKKHRMASLFKVGVCLYFCAHCKGDCKTAGDCASLGRSTVEAYLAEFCNGVIKVLKPIFMPSTPPSPAVLQGVRDEFAARRGISNVAMACDGTHLPFRGGPEYRNYKGWTSILCVAFVTSFHTFVDADIGAPGRSGDNTVLTDSAMMEAVNQDPVAWLGVDGVIAADGGVCLCVVACLLPPAPSVPGYNNTS